MSSGVHAFVDVEEEGVEGERAIEAEDAKARATSAFAVVGVMMPDRRGESIAESVDEGIISGEKIGEADADNRAPKSWMTKFAAVLPGEIPEGDEEEVRREDRR